jgi:antitoxin VapB
MNEKPRITKPAAIGKLFKNGRSQAVRIPAEFRFEGTEVEFRPGPNPGEVILAPAYRRTGSLKKFFEARDKLRPEDIPEGFPWRDRHPHDRDPFA